MKIRLKDAGITIIYILVLLCSIVYMRYSYLHSQFLEKLYIGIQLMIVFCCIVYLISNTRIITVRIFPILLIGFIIYELVVSYFTGLFITPNILMDVLPWPLVTCVYYSYSRRNELPECFSALTIIGFIVVCFVSIPNIFHREITGTGIFGTYYCISVLAMVYYTVKNKRIIAVFSIVTAVLMLFTVKRAAIIATITGIGIYYFFVAINEEQAPKKIRKLIGFIILALLAVIFGPYLIEKMNPNIIHRMELMSEDGGSGRTRIWELIINQYNLSSQQQKLYGHGFHAVYYHIRPFGLARFAHNSFIETLYDYGIIGLSILLWIVITIIVRTLRMIKAKQETVPGMAFAIIIMITLSLVSYFFEQSTIIMPLCIMWGDCLGRRIISKRDC